MGKSIILWIAVFSMGWSGGYQFHKWNSTRIITSINKVKSILYCDQGLSEEENGRYGAALYYYCFAVNVDEYDIDAHLSLIALTKKHTSDDVANFAKEYALRCIDESKDLIPEAKERYRNMINKR